MLKLFPLLQGSRGPKILQYKVEAYCKTNRTCIAVLFGEGVRGPKPHPESRNTKTCRVYTNFLQKFARTSACFPVAFRNPTEIVHSLNLLWPKMAGLGPLFATPTIPPKKFMWVPFLRSFPGYEANILFWGEPTMEGFGWGPKSLC